MAATTSGSDTNSRDPLAVADGDRDDLVFAFFDERNMAYHNLKVLNSQFAAQPDDAVVLGLEQQMRLLDESQHVIERVIKKFPMVTAKDLADFRVMNQRLQARDL